MNQIRLTAPRLSPGRSRREALACSARGAVVLGIAPRVGAGRKATKVLTEALVLRDPDIPVAGNADGDITIVEYFDYNCPYCRKLEPELRQVVQDDGKVRLVLEGLADPGADLGRRGADGAGEQIPGQIRSGA